jgi:hypothetical protein
MQQYRHDHSWTTEPGTKLSQQLLKGLPGTVLELRIRPYMLF